ncbi:ubiquitin-conjugating enzyme/RWD-like protein, partial [Pavlovales sp. CCMP2436]
MTSQEYNPKLPSVKRILQEARELTLEPCDMFRAAPLEGNLFEWHFTVRGPVETAFEGGRFHGRLILPPEYPFKPPAVMLLTPNGRFEVRKRICLSISDFHPEQWQPAW